jgi:hypothetical protein
MSLFKRIKKCAMFDRDEFIAIAADEKATNQAWGLLGAAGFCCAVGLSRLNPLNMLQTVLLAGLLTAVAVYVAIHTSATSDQTRKRPLRQWIRVAGFAAVPGLSGLLGALFIPFAWLAVGWWMASLIHAVGTVRNPGTKKIDWDSAFPMLGAGAAVLGVYMVAFGNLVSLLVFFLGLALIVNHRALLARWCDHPPGATITPLKDLIRLWHAKRWAITLDEIVTIVLGESPTAKPKAPPVTVDTFSPPVQPSTPPVAPKENPADKKESSPPKPAEKSEEPKEKKPVVVPEVVVDPDNLSESVILFRDRCFGANVYGHESEKRFNEEFKGKTMKWQGKLMRVEPFSYDRFLGRDAGYRAFYLLAPIKSDFGDKQLEAVVQIDKARFEGLEKLVETHQEFEGELIALESYTCRAYLRAAGQTPAKKKFIVT